MISYMISVMILSNFYDIIHDIIQFMISYMISYMMFEFCDIYPLQRRILPGLCRDPVENRGLDGDRQMDFDEERDFADQGPLTDIDMEEDAQILATFLKHLHL